MKNKGIASLSFAVGVSAGVIGGAMAVLDFAEKELKKRQKIGESERENAIKYQKLFVMMNQWVNVKQNGKNLAVFFEKHGYRKIAIYGMSYAGSTLAGELKGTNIRVAYGIDKRSDSLNEDIEIVTLEDELAPVDAIVVTAVTFFEEIEEELCRKVDWPVISLTDVLCEI